jgi:hypothetical protein
MNMNFVAEFNTICIENKHIGERDQDGRDYPESESLLHPGLLPLKCAGKTCALPKCSASNRQQIDYPVFGIRISTPQNEALFPEKDFLQVVQPSISRQKN